MNYYIVHFIMANKYDLIDYSRQRIPNFATIDGVLWKIWQKHFGMFFRFTV